MRILFSFLIFFSLSAQAVEVKFQKRSKDGHSVLMITGGIEYFQNFPNLIFKNKTRIVISSQGGNPHGVRPLMDWFIREIAELRSPPEVIVRGQCSSSCLLILANLNSLARTANVKLILDENLPLGFHGCANKDSGKYSKECTSKMALYQMIHGVSYEWMMDNIELYARPNFDYVKRIKITDPQLKGSRLFNYGTILKNTHTLTNP